MQVVNPGPWYDSARLHSFLMRPSALGPYAVGSYTQFPMSHVLTVYAPACSFYVSSRT
jgi:hypothetical protein